MASKQGKKARTVIVGAAPQKARQTKASRAAFRAVDEKIAAFKRSVAKDKN